MVHFLESIMVMALNTAYASLLALQLFATSLTFTGSSIKRISPLSSFLIHAFHMIPLRFPNMDQ